MVQIDKSKQVVEITFTGKQEDIKDIQKALIDLMQQYNFKDFGNIANEPFYIALEVLRATL